MLQDIEQHINLVEKSIAWAKEYNKDSFPYDVFKDYRRQLKRIHNALSDNCSAAAYGESQVGKSYLKPSGCKTTAASARFSCSGRRTRSGGFSRCGKQCTDFPRSTYTQSRASSTTD